MQYDDLRQMMDEAPIKGYAIINRTAREILFNGKSAAFIILLSLITLPVFYWSVELAGTSETREATVGGQVRSNLLLATFDIPEKINPTDDAVFQGIVFNEGDREVAFSIKFFLAEELRENNSLVAQPGIPLQLNFTYSAAELTELSRPYTSYDEADVRIELYLAEDSAAISDILELPANVDFSDIESFDDILALYEDAQDNPNPYWDGGVDYVKDTIWEGIFYFVSYDEMLSDAGLRDFGTASTVLYETGKLTVNLTGPDFLNNSREENVTVIIHDHAELHVTEPVYRLQLFVGGTLLDFEQIALSAPAVNTTMTIPAGLVSGVSARLITLYVRPENSPDTYLVTEYTAVFLDADTYRADIVKNVSAETSQRNVGTAFLFWIDRTYEQPPELWFNFYTAENREINVDLEIETIHGKEILTRELPAAYDVNPSYPALSTNYSFERSLYEAGEAVDVAVKIRWDAGDKGGGSDNVIASPISFDVLDDDDFYTNYLPLINEFYKGENATVRDVYAADSICRVDIPHEITARKDHVFKGRIENSGELDKDFVLAVILQNHTEMTEIIHVGSGKHQSFRLRFDTADLVDGFDTPVSLLLFSFDGNFTGFVPGLSIDDLLADENLSIRVEGYSEEKTDVFELGLVEQQSVDGFLEVFAEFMVLMTMLGSLIFGSAIFGQEIESRTMNLLVTQPISKLEIVTYKYIGYLLAVPVLMFIPTILIYTGFSSAESGLFVRNLGLLGIALFTVFLVIAAMGAVFMTFGSFTKRPIFPGLTYMMIWEVLISRSDLFLQRYTISHHVRSIIYPLMKEYSNDAADTLHLVLRNGDIIATSQTTSLMSISVSILMILGLNVLILKYRDYS